MLDLLSNYSTLLTTIISTLTGGGLVQGYRVWANQGREDRGQAYDQIASTAQRLEDRLVHVEKRVDNQDQKLLEYERKLNQSRIRETEMQAAIDELVRRIDELIKRLAQHEHISPQERDDLRSVPFVDQQKSQ
jgi:chromosome segregation ATPase